MPTLKFGMPNSAACLLKLLGAPPPTVPQPEVLIVSIRILVGCPVSVGVVVKGRPVNCGLKTLTPESEPLPVNGVPVTNSDVKPLYLSIDDVSCETSTPPVSVCLKAPVSNL